MIRVVLICDRCGSRAEEAPKLQNHTCVSLGGPTVSVEAWTRPQPEGWSVIDYNLYCSSCIASFRDWRANAKLVKA